MEIRTKSGTAKGMPLSDIQENNKWLKVLAVSFAVFVIFIIAFALWLKFSGIGHNIIYELSPKAEVNLIKEMCPEIDEICEQDFIRMCRYSIPEIIGIDTDTYCDRIFEARCEDANCYCNDAYTPNKGR
mgnify:FL=1